ncbi:nucleoside hydrolase [Schizopora paradoxa]|uniref:Nucleoside hydrolase n=1 Tax=Schizopora paradoxa TaxID=27342 RepID=A0A0H2SCE0_9AGAM|nr:nucleoside hydrolase [Schizopora paradoxa]
MSPIPVIIDTDPGVDDIVAILYALASPEIEIIAFIVSFGNTDVESSYKNILKLFDVLSRHFEQFPDHRARFPGFSSRPYIARGPSGPLEGALHSAQYFHGLDGLGNIHERHRDTITTGRGAEFLRASGKAGHELALELVRSYPPRSITYIALGPLTNLALMVREDPAACRDHLDRVVCMGGALDVPGNTSPVAEFNFFADPFAVKELLMDGGFPLERFVLLPLDVTTPHELRFPLYASRVDNTFKDTSAPSQASAGKPPLVHFTSAFLERAREVMVAFGKDAMELHDVCAVWYAVANPPLGERGLLDPGHAEGWKAHPRLFDIERTGELTRGMLVVDRRDESTTHGPGENRSEVQAALEKTFSDATAPALVMKENSQELTSAVPKGVHTVFRTPGTDALLKSMLARVWGVEL